jgi:EAL domain-containing protein (putative c-di-GMP-specific phosphodiesterase class I)/CHASE2 domain-containing sensor protein
LPGLLERLRPTWRSAALAAAASMGIAILSTGAGAGFEEAVRTLRDGWFRHGASGDVHIIEIDGRSIATFKHWPWPRSVHAAAVDRLREAGVRSIAFDVDLSSRSDPKQDQALAAALRRAGGSVILPAFRQTAGSDDSASIESRPIRELADHAFIAAANVLPDPDGQLRTMPYAVDIGGAPRPSLASMIAENPGAAGEGFIIDRSIDPKSVPSHSMADLLSGRIPKSRLAGKRIIIGATAVELGDRYVVPGHGLLPGVVIQAMAAETLIAGTPPRPLSAGWALLFALILGGLALRARGRPGTTAFLYAAAWPAILALPFVAYFPIAPALAALVTVQLIGGAAFALARFRERAITDAETGLPNLAALDSECRGESAVTLVVARIEDFATLASAVGAGDAAQLVRRTAERLALAAPAGRVYRIDEGTLAWVESIDGELDERFAGVDALMRTALDRNHAVEVRLHFGTARGDGAEARQLCADAGFAARTAAESGVRWQRFTARHSEEANLKVALLADLDAALVQGQLWNAYQPKLDLASGRIVAVEALVRWNHPERGPLAPDSFIPLIEQQGRAGELTLHVMAEALRDAASWREAGLPLGVAVNISATLLHDPLFMLRLEERLRSSGLPAASVTLEVTESAAMADPEVAVAALDRWRRLGVGVSIDDYGTGQSSLAYLQTLPATELKIDKSFIAVLSQDPRNAILVRSTIAMAHELGLKVVAEGVEEESCLQRLEEMGCDLIQGYGISRPIAADAVAGFARDFAHAPSVSKRKAAG